MKAKFTTPDLVAALTELKCFVGYRVMNVYDIDSKTYLLKLMKPDAKAMILFESGARIHSTDFEWPKSQMPSGFSMKLRKHIKQKRLEQISQLGIDRIVDLQFGSGEVACHVIVEFYDRGNVVLTDSDYVILNILRPRTDKDTDVRFAVREKYPLHLARSDTQLPSKEKLVEILIAAKLGEFLRKVLNPHFAFGAAILEHCLDSLPPIVQTSDLAELSLSAYADRVGECLKAAEAMFNELSTRTTRMGVIVYKYESKARVDANANEPEKIEAYVEFHPMLFKQHASQPIKMFDSFNHAVDEFFSRMESQKLDLKSIQQERTALQKLENIRTDHETRVRVLQTTQRFDARRAELIELNKDLVDKAILVLRSAIANQLSWDDIQQLVAEAKLRNDPVAQAIKLLKLDINHVALLLRDPYAASAENADELTENTSKTGGEQPSSTSAVGGNKKNKKARKADAVSAADSNKDPMEEKQLIVDIDLNLGAFANARKYYDEKRLAGIKEEKTLDASKRALKSAEAKTKETLKQVAIKATVSKSRRQYWFEKFLWFISSENYLIIAGRDQQQNELLVKRYLKPGDVYVHADIRGAASVIVKNSAPSDDSSSFTPIPPKTVNEAGAMAICYSAAWDAKVVTSAWWVHHDQVSKTAPSGEYLTTGSFMIRGKKNFLPPCQLVMGFGFLFWLDDESLPNHAGERAVVSSSASDVQLSQDEVAQRLKMESESTSLSQEVDEEIQLSDDDAEVEEVEEGAFPDIEVKVGHIERLLSESSTARSVGSVGSPSFDAAAGDAYSIVQTGKPVKIKQMTAANAAKKIHAANKKNKKTGHQPVTLLSQNADVVEDNESSSHASSNAQQAKRGQKFKNKKIKGKYRDQDDEERRLRMQILGSAGVSAVVKGKQTTFQNRAQNDSNSKPPASATNRPKAPAPKQGQAKQPQTSYALRDKPLDETSLSLGATGSSLATPSSLPSISNGAASDTMPELAAKSIPSATVEMAGEASDDASDGEESAEDEKANDAASAVDDSLRIINCLTGCPLPDDVLVFAMPVCAPYNVMANYKFKVKLTPGTGKRGKATKTAVQIFMKDKSITTREKDLLKSVADLDLSRNLPGKVKVSAPQLQAVKQQQKRH